MLSRVIVKESGETDMMRGEVVDKSKFIEINRAMKKLKKKGAKAIQTVVGITRVALTTESFLSAASFQETSRVLVNAAVEGKMDLLRGLKENVIIGKIIPVGTGWKQTHAPTTETGGDEGIMAPTDEHAVRTPEEAALEKEAIAEIEEMKGDENDEE